MNLLAGLIPLFAALILAAVIITLVRRSSKGARSYTPRPTDADPNFIPGLIASQALLNQPTEADAHPHSHPHASSPAPHATEIHHTLPSHFPSHDHSSLPDTSSPSHDAGSFDSGSHSHH